MVQSFLACKAQVTDVSLLNRRVPGSQRLGLHCPSRGSWRLQGQLAMLSLQQVLTVAAWCPGVSWLQKVLSSTIHLHLEFSGVACLSAFQGLSFLLDFISLLSAKLHHCCLRLFSCYDEASTDFHTHSLLALALPLFLDSMVIKQYDIILL